MKQALESVKGSIEHVVRRLRDQQVKTEFATIDDALNNLVKKNYHTSQQLE
jgi:hypothetical protein